MFNIIILWICRIWEFLKLWNYVLGKENWVQAVITWGMLGRWEGSESVVEDMHSVCHSSSAQHRLPQGKTNAHSLSVTCPPFPSATHAGDPPSAWVHTTQLSVFMDQAVAEEFPVGLSAGAEGTAQFCGAQHCLITGESIQPANQKCPVCSSLGVWMSPTRNLYLCKAEDDVRDNLHAQGVGVKAQQPYIFLYVFVKTVLFQKMMSTFCFEVL